MATAPFTTEKPLHGAEPPDCFESQIGRGRSTFYPDLAYIRRCVPIDDVAKRLGLQVSGKMVRCWRPDNHEHGDRTPSVGLNSRRNIAKCFVCDGRALSPIDLVMSVREEDLAAAVRWIVARFEVPAAPKGRHIQPPKRWLERFRIGTNGGSLETLIRSGIWASLTPAQRSLIPVLQTFMESGTSKVKISYRGMMRYAGVRSHSTISSSLKRFRALRLLRVESSGDGKGLRACNIYELCFDDPDFLACASRCFHAQKEQVEGERKLRKTALRKRQAERLLPVNTLSNGWRAVESHAPTSRTVE